MNKLSQIGNNIVGSEIIKISQTIKEISKTKKVQNLTIGDFDPAVNPIPLMLMDYIKYFYEQGLTNYPLSAGELSLRKAVSTYLDKTQNIQYTENEILVGCGVRPLIYTIFKAIVNPGESVIYPVPSWNNNHYSFLHDAQLEAVECTPENSFFPTVDDIKSRMNSTVSLICLCSPQNPTGRIIDKDVLKGICEIIVEENRLRKMSEGTRPCYLFFDQIYSDLILEGEQIHPTILVPEIREYLICADGISKSLCATGVRVGWIFGPQDIIGKMTEIFSHIGAWAAKPEQNAVARYLDFYTDMRNFIGVKTGEYRIILSRIYEIFTDMKERGFRVDAKSPEGGIYLSVYLGYANSFPSTESYVKYLINECGLGIVPFEYFGSKMNPGWFRISIGNVGLETLHETVDVIQKAILKSHSQVNATHL